MIVPQRALGEDTSTLSSTAPALWAYLNAHSDVLDRRKSSIYRGRPRFSVFGIGRYSFAPWKVAVSGLHKAAAFNWCHRMRDDPSFWTTPATSWPSMIRTRR